MNIVQFAKASGVQFATCDIDWGGRFAYIDPNYPSARFNGYKTKTDAAEAWMRSLGIPELGMAVIRQALKEFRP